jgi:hypothetical protein
MRPHKEGIDFFPLEVNIEADEKIQYLENTCGAIGFAVYIKLLARIYKQGYYYEWDVRAQKMLAGKIGQSQEQLAIIIAEIIEAELFDPDLYTKYRIFTSRSIQERWLFAVKRRRKIDVVKEYWLLQADVDINPVNVNINPVNVNNNPVNVNINSQSKVKESKVKKRGKEDVLKTAAEVRAEISKNYSPELHIYNAFSDTFEGQPPNTIKTPHKALALFKRIKKLREERKLSEADVIEIIRTARSDSLWSKNFLSLQKLDNSNKDGVKYIDVFIQLTKGKRNDQAPKQLNVIAGKISEGRAALRAIRGR